MKVHRLAILASVLVAHTFALHAAPDQTVTSQETSSPEYDKRSEAGLATEQENTVPSQAQINRRLQRQIVSLRRNDRADNTLMTSLRRQVRSLNTDLQERIRRVRRETENWTRQELNSRIGVLRTNLSNELIGRVARIRQETETQVYQEFDRQINVLQASLLSEILARVGAGSVDPQACLNANDLRIIDTFNPQTGPSSEQIASLSPACQVVAPHMGPCLSANDLNIITALDHSAGPTPGQVAALSSACRTLLESMMGEGPGTGGPSIRVSPGTGGPSSVRVVTPPCADSSAAVVSVATGGIAGNCAAVASMCNDATHGANLRLLCPLTCNACP